MFTKLTILALVPVVLAAQQAQMDTAAHPVSAAEAVKLAQQNNLSAISSENAVRTATNTIRSTKAQLYPTLSLTAGQNISAGDRIGQSGTLVPYTPVWQYSTGLSSNVTLFDGGKTFADVRAARANVTSLQAAEVNTDFSLALQVKTQYNAALAANEQLNAARAQLLVAQSQLDMTIAKVNAGAANVADSLNSVVQVGNAQFAILTADQSLRTANANLTRIAGTPYMITAQPSDTIERPSAAIDSAAVLGLALSGPQIRQNQAQIAAAHATLSSARTAYFPTLSMGLSFSGNGTKALYGLNGSPYPYTRGANFSINYPIFNRWQRENQISNAQISIENAQATLKDNQLGAKQTIVTQLGLLHNAEAQVRIQENTIRANEEALRVAQQRYQLGAGTFLDVLTSQSNLVSARQTLIQARLNYRNARAQIEAVIGKDLP
ncbi:MAG: TolC family protein [Gemmatimonadaceae bacterium]